VTEIDFAYFSYEHGGRICGKDRLDSSGRGYDFGGLVRVAGDRGRWPRILVMGFPTAGLPIVLVTCYFASRTRP
jgi:hypothetical protein